MNQKSKNPVVIIGAGGHAKVLAEVLETSEYEILGLINNVCKKDEKVFGYKILGDDEVIKKFYQNGVSLVNGIGSVPNKYQRWNLAEKIRKQGFSFINVIHSGAILSRDIVLDGGVQIMAGCVIQPGVHIGLDSIINTGTIIEHDCYIGSNSHLAPGVVLSGDVKVGNGTHIGTGVSIIQGISIGSNVVIAAGSVVYQDIPDNVKYIQPRNKIIEAH